MCTVSKDLWYPDYSGRLIWIPLDVFMDGLVYYYTDVPAEDIHDVNVSIAHNPVLESYLAILITEDALFPESQEDPDTEIVDLMAEHAGQIGVIMQYTEGGHPGLLCGCDYPDWSDLELGSDGLPRLIEEGIARVYPLLFNAALEPIDPSDEDEVVEGRYDYESCFIYDAHRDDIERAYGFDESALAAPARDAFEGEDIPPDPDSELRTVEDLPSGNHEIYGCWACYAPESVVFWDEDDVAIFQASAFADDEYDEDVAAG